MGRGMMEVEAAFKVLVPVVVVGGGGCAVVAHVIC
jgi:hypothetical protein